MFTSTVRRKECCVWCDVCLPRQRRGVVEKETHSCRLCATPAPRFLVWVCAWENCGATDWDQENKRNKLSLNTCLTCPWASKAEIPIRQLTLQVWNLRGESHKFKGCAQRKRMTFSDKVLESKYGFKSNLDIKNTMWLITQVNPKYVVSKKKKYESQRYKL